MFSFLFVGNNSFAEEEVVVIPPDPVSIHLKITSGENSLYDKDIIVTPCDSDSDQATEDTITAYCAILQSGLESDWNWAWAPGAFVNSIAGIVGYTSKDKDDKDVYHYWSWSLNNEVAMTGLNQYLLQTDDQILLEFIDPVEEVEPEIIDPPKHHSSSGSVASYVKIEVIEKSFSISK